METKHSILAPSKAARWMTCAGSIAACKDIPDTGGIYADEGSAAHAVAAALLKGESAVAALAALKTFYDKEVDYYDAINYIDSYVLAIRNAAEGKILLVEQSLDLARWTSENGGRGTADAIILDLENGLIEVWDLKFGVGHVVWAAQNPQTMLYGLGALDLVEFAYGPVAKIKVVIFQPRRDHADYDVLTRQELLQFGGRSFLAGAFALSIADATKEIYEQFLKPSEEACLFCPFAGQCPARTKMVQDAVFQEFVVVEPGKVQALTKPLTDPDWQTLETLNLIEDWVGARKDYIYSQLRSGVKNPNWKLTLGRGGNRKFIDEEKVIKHLKALKFKKDQIFESKLLPLTKIEKLVPKGKWPVFEALISRTPPQPIAVSMKDKRQEWVGEMDVNEFENVEENFDAFK